MDEKDLFLALFFETEEGGLVNDCFVRLIESARSFVQFKTLGGVVGEHVVDWELVL